MSTANTVTLKADDNLRYDEKIAGVAITPGYLIESYNDSGTTKVRPHTTRGGTARRTFAIEDALQGGTIDDAYSVGAIVRFNEYRSGDWVNALLKAGENVTKEDYLISYGDGTLAKAASAFLANIAAASSTVTNTVTETTFSNGTVTIPENTLKVGDIIRVRLHGTVPSTNSTDTLNIKLKIGSTVIAQTAAFNVTNADVFLIDAHLIVRTIGATGTVVGNALTHIGIINSTAASASALGSTTVDTTGDLSLTVTATWSVAHADNQCALQSLIVEHVKAGTGVGTAEGVQIIAQANESVNLSSEEDNDRISVTIL